MKNISIWLDTYKIKDYPKLNNNLNVDVLIIGGGLTGISSLYHLKDTNLKVALIEQNKIGQSVTGKSTGKLSYLQNDLIDKIRSNYNDKVASLYLKSQIDAINIITNVIKKEKISCDLEKTESILYTNKKEEINKLKNLESFLNKNNINTYKTNNSLVNNKYMFKVENTYLFHPLKFIDGLIKPNFEIYENTSIKRIKKDKDYYLCYTDSNIIKTKYVILASHYPYFIMPYLFPFKTSLEKSYLSASPYQTDNISLISYSNPFVSIRNYKDNLIYLSNSHNTNNNVCDKENFIELQNKISNLNLKPNYLWSNIDIITNDGLPIIGRLKDNILIGTGYNTWGLTTSFLAGKILSDIILNNDNEYLKLFNPKRKYKGILKSTYKTLEGYINGLFYKNNKKVHFCPHAGCKLIYNDLENTWDCPCHGSRFTKNGKCISGPSNKDIN